MTLSRSDQRHEAHDMCEHCGCRGIEPIADLMDEHYEILDIAGDVRRLLAADDRHAAAAKLA